MSLNLSDRIFYKYYHIFQFYCDNKGINERYKKQHHYNQENPKRSGNY